MHHHSSCQLDGVWCRDRMDKWNAPPLNPWMTCDIVWSLGMGEWSIRSSVGVIRAPASTSHP